MIIGIIGRKGHGKDLVAQIIRYLTSSEYIYNGGVVSYSLLFEEWQQSNNPTSTEWEVKKFAEKLKQIICLLIGCTREQLESEEFKSSVLPREWDRYAFNGEIFATKEEFLKRFPIFTESSEEAIEIMSIRKLLQLMGTDAMRNVIHPNIHINALFADYVKKGTDSEDRVASDGGYYTRPGYKEYPKWIISDCRFLNEHQAIVDRKGFGIKVYRPIVVKTNAVLHHNPIQEVKQTWYLQYRVGETCLLTANPTPDNGNYGAMREFKITDTDLPLTEHVSESEVDLVPAKYEIRNDGTIEQLIEKVRRVLIIEKIIN
jgi:hypothetical protein